MPKRKKSSLWLKKKQSEDVLLVFLHPKKGAQAYLSLRYCTCAALNGDLCAIHASSEYSGVSVHLRRHNHWTMRLVSRSIVLAA